MEKRLLELAVGLVQAQASGHRMSEDEVESSLLRIYNALFRLREAEREGRLVNLALSEGHAAAEGWTRDLGPRESIKEDKVICLECGVELRQLTANHLRSHKMTPREYKKKWGFPQKQPLAAKSLTKLRSRSAKRRGLPAKLQEYQEDQRRKKNL